jgi:chemotaxis protein CheD
MTPDELRFDRIVKPNENGELVLPIAHYALLNSNNPYKNSIKISVFGLGSCVIIILIDPIKKLHSMAHVLLPLSEINDNSLINYPHKYVNTSIKDLVDKLIERGAKSKNLKAILIGGATIFDNEFNYIGKQNIEMARKILNSLGIKIHFEDVGGRKGRTVVYNAKDYSISIKTTKSTIIKKLINKNYSFD